MKTRIVYTKIFNDEYYRNLTDKEKTIFMFLLFNEKVNMCGIYEMPDWLICATNKIEEKELAKIKDKFQKDNKFLFVKGWVKIVNNKKYNNYTGSINEKAKAKELKDIPNEIKDYSINTLSIGYQETSDSLYNKKSEIINNKSIKGGVGGIKSEEKEKINFNIFWEAYQKKVGDKEKIEKKWDKLPRAEQELVIDYLPKYIEAQPEKRYRKNPETFLNNKSWNDEIIDHNAREAPAQPWNIPPKLIKI